MEPRMVVGIQFEEEDDDDDDDEDTISHTTITPNNTQIVIERCDQSIYSYIPNDWINHEQVRMVHCRIGDIYIVTYSYHVYRIHCESPYDPNRTPSSSGEMAVACERITFPHYESCMDTPQIIQMASGYAFDFFVCKSGRVYYSGQIESSGMTRTSRSISSSSSSSSSCPKLLHPKLLNYEKCVMVACAAYSACFVTENEFGFHNLYMYGSNQFGECATGFGSNRLINVPTQVKTSIVVDGDDTVASSSSEWRWERVKRMSAGDHSFIFVTESGKVFVCGYNPSNELCLTRSNRRNNDNNSNNIQGTTRYSVTRLTEVLTRDDRRSSSAIIDCSSRYYSNVFLSDDGKLYTSNNFFDTFSSSTLRERRYNPPFREYTFKDHGIHDDIQSIGANNSTLVLIDRRNRVFQVKSLPFTSHLVRKRFWNINSLKGEQVVGVSCGTYHIVYYLHPPEVSEMEKRFSKLKMEMQVGKLSDVNVIAFDKGLTNESIDFIRDESHH